MSPCSDNVMGLTSAEYYAHIHALSNGLRYIRDFNVPDYANNKAVASFNDMVEAKWAIHIMRLILRPRPVLVTAWNSIRGDVLVQVHSRHKHIGYMLRLEHQPELQRRIKP